MVAFAVGGVVLVPFPFSDLTQTKLRPALVLATAGRDDWILCQITSISYGDAKAIELRDVHLQSGSLRVKSFVRPTKLFTAHHSLIVAQVGVLHPEPFNRIIDAVVEIFRTSPAP